MKKILFGTLFASTPIVALAVDNYTELMNRIIELVDVFVPVILGIAILYTVYQAYLFIIAGADGAKRAEAQNGMGYGILAVFVMISVWGLINILINTFFFTSSDFEASKTVPQLYEGP